MAGKYSCTYMAHKQRKKCMHLIFLIFIYLLKPATASSSFYITKCFLNINLSNHRIQPDCSYFTSKENRPPPSHPQLGFFNVIVMAILELSIDQASLKMETRSSRLNEVLRSWRIPPESSLAYVIIRTKLPGRQPWRSQAWIKSQIIQLWSGSTRGRQTVPNTQGNPWHKQNPCSYRQLVL